MVINIANSKNIQNKQIQEREKFSIMDELQNKPINLRPDAFKLIPCSLWTRFMCCVVYDGHPFDKKKIDITICLQGGKVLELYQRECVSSIRLSDVISFREIQIIRSSKGELYYLVAAECEVFILSSTDHLSVHRRFSNVIHYEVCDPECSGEAKLMLQTESSTVYISFGDVKELSQQGSRNTENIKPVISSLAEKLNEAKYNLDCNKNAYERIEKLRQRASFLCNEDCALQLNTSKPIVKFCNKKIVIQLDVENLKQVPMKNVFVLIHNNSCNSISYTSKVYEHLSTSPFYKEIVFREIKGQCKASIVAVIPINEFKNSISSRIDFNIVVSYEIQNTDYLQSFDDIQISAMDVMGKNFDVFNSPEVDERTLCLAMLSTTLKTNLCLKQKGLEDMISLSTIFSMYLQMDLLGERKKLAVHKQSPHHILHGILIVFDNNEEYIDASRNEINYNIEVYARSPSQVLALLHFIYDKVPLTLIVTTPNIRVTPHEDSDEDPGELEVNYDYSQSADSLLKQSSLTLEYLDNCLKEMNKSNNMDKTDIQIDLFAMGLEEFVKYRNNMLAEAENGFEHFVKASATNDEIMDVD